MTDAPIDWAEITIQSLQGLWEGFIVFIPELIGALLVFIVGWFVAVGVGRLVADLLKRARFNDAFESGGWKHALERAELQVDPAGFIGAIFKWVLVIVFLLAAVDILGMTAFSDWLKDDVLGYLPNVLVATLIFVVTVIIADIAQRLVRAGVEGAQVGYGQAAGMIAKWSIWIFALIAILTQLGIATEMLQTLFTGLVAMIALAGGLAFGLGGKEVAGEILSDLKTKLKK